MLTHTSKNTFKLTAIATAITLLTACGGSDSVTEPPKELTDIVDDKKDDIIDDKKDDIVDDKTLEGTFVDSAVAGIDYVCGEDTGVTNADGKFNYKSGASCTFKIGEVVLGSIAEMTEKSFVVTPFDIVEDKEKAIKIGALLQTIDADGNPENGIDITNFDAKAKGLTAEILAGDEDTFYKAVFDLTGLTAVTLDAAQQHMELSLGQAKGFHSKAIEDVITKIEGVSDVEQLDMEAFLAEINTILETGDDSNDSDIKVLQAIISIFEVINDPRVQARVQLTTDAGYTKMLPQIIDASMNSAESMLKAPMNSTEDISGLFFEMSTRLAAASDTLDASFADSSYVANYGEDLSLSANSAHAIQAAALGYSSVLAYFSAYNYASDDYYLPKTFEKKIDVIQVTYKSNDIYLDQPIYSAQSIDAEADYTIADTRPDLHFKDNDFGRLHNDQKHLTLAKSSMMKLLELGKKVYNQDSDDTTAEKKANSDTIDKYMAHLSAEDGSKTPLDLSTLHDDVEGKLNMQAMYSLETALDRDDFNITASIDCGPLSYSDDYSKYMDTPMCSSGTYTDGEEVDDSSSTYVYEDDSSYSLIYAVQADIQIDVEPKSEEQLFKRLVPECNAIEEDGTKIDCLDVD